MTLPQESRLRFVDNLPICRILNGMWQVSGAHGRIDPRAAVDAMLAYHDAGFTTWDLADHYGPAEDFIGEFRRRLATERGEGALSEIQAFTKWVPSPGPMTRQIVENNVDISRRRMGVERLDLLQFHWWEYRDKRFLDALEQLTALRDEGKIHRVALTNFDTERLREIADHGMRVVSNQVQYSLIDRRPEVQMAQVCEEQRVWLLPYGVLCGGLLSDRYLGQPEPRSAELNTASLRKYKQMVDAWGGWQLFQRLLAELKNRRRQTRRQHRERRGALHTGQTGGGRRDYRSPARRGGNTSPKTQGSSAFGWMMTTIRPSMRCWPMPATCTRSSAIAATNIADDRLDPTQLRPRYQCKSALFSRKLRSAPTPMPSATTCKPWRRWSLTTCSSRTTCWARIRISTLMSVAATIPTTA